MLNRSFREYESEDMNLDLKYRPFTINDIVGNQSNVEALKSSIETGKTPKFMIFTGQPGCGKTTSAYVVAANIITNGKFGREDYDQTEYESIYMNLYRNGESDTWNNIHIFDIGAQGDLEYIQNIANNIKSGSINGKRFIIIDELQMVPLKLQDPLLKATEFIPDNVHIIITTSEPKKIAKALKDRADLSLTFTNPSQEEAYKFLREVIESEHIKLKADDLKRLLRLNKNNLRKCLKALTFIKSSPDAGLTSLIESKEKEYEKYINYFEKIDTNILELIFYIEDIEDQVGFIKSLPFFIKDYLKMSLSGKGFSKAFRDRVLDVMLKYNEEKLIQIMGDTLKLNIYSEEFAETYLINLAYEINKPLQETKYDKDGVFIRTLTQKQEEMDISELSMIPLTEKATVDSVGINIDDIM